MPEPFAPLIAIARRGIPLPHRRFAPRRRAASPAGVPSPARTHAGPSRHRYPIEIQPLTQTDPIHRPPYPPVTHLAKKALKMRHKISGIRRNPLKQRSLQGHK